MEDEVALNVSEQKKFQKSVKGIKKLIKSGKIKPRTDKDAKRSRFPRGVEKKPKKEKGLVYISHIPHGFYENEMAQYFKQFGVVRNVRVLRSARTGRSKGAAFVEFLEPAVANIVADTMNNYLMGKRLLKAVVIPPEKQKPNALRKNWNSFQNPSSEYRRKMKKIYNQNGTDQEDLKSARKQLKNVLQTKQKLKEIGIDYDFFTPVDVPEELLPLLEGTTVNDISQYKKKLKEKKDQKQGKASVVVNTNKIDKKVTQKEHEPLHKGKAKTTDTKDFIKINTKPSKKTSKSETKEGSEDSNDEFDSDEFEMTLESDDDDLESGDEESGDDDNDDDEIIKELPAPVKFSLTKPVQKQTVPNKKALKTAPLPVIKQIDKKRKPDQKPAVPAKKSKDSIQSSPHKKNKKTKKGANKATEQLAGEQLAGVKKNKNKKFRN